MGLSLYRHHQCCYCVVGTGLLLVLLAVSDFLVLSTGTLRSWVWVFTDMTVDIAAVNGITCRLHTWLTYLSVHLSAWTLVLVTCERLVAVYKPMASRTWMTRRNLAGAYGVILLTLSVIDSHLMSYPDVTCTNNDTDISSTTWKLKDVYTTSNDDTSFNERSTTTNDFRDPYSIITKMYKDMSINVFNTTARNVQDISGYLHQDTSTMLSSMHHDISTMPSIRSRHDTTHTMSSSGHHDIPTVHSHHATQCSHQDIMIYLPCHHQGISISPLCTQFHQDIIPSPVCSPTNKMIPPSLHLPLVPDNVSIPLQGVHLGLTTFSTQISCSAVFCQGCSSLWPTQW